MDSDARFPVTVFIAENGLLHADENADLLDPKSWTKSPKPVFQTNFEAGLYGPGHNSFTTTPDGRTDLLVYHARSYQEIQGDLQDPDEGQGRGQ